MKKLILVLFLLAGCASPPPLVAPPPTPSQWARDNMITPLGFTGTDESGMKWVGSTAISNGWQVTAVFVADYDALLKKYGAALPHPNPNPEAGVASVPNGFYWVSNQVIDDHGTMTQFRNDSAKP